MIGLPDGPNFAIRIAEMEHSNEISVICFFEKPHFKY